MQVTEMVERFITSRRAMGLSENTVKWYRNILTLFDNWLQSHVSQELSPEMMEYYLLHLRRRGKRSKGEYTALSDTSIASCFRALRTFFGWAVKRGYLDRSPCVGVTLKKPERKEPRHATRGEVDQLLASIPATEWLGARDRLIICVAFFAALRVGEIVQLELGSFDLDNMLLRVPGGKTGAGQVPLLPEVVTAYRDYLPFYTHGVSPRLFLSSNGHDRPRDVLTESGVRTMFVHRCRRAGLRHLNPHSMRHGLAMYLLNHAGADMATIQALLRHADIQTTSQHYARWQFKTLGQEFRRLMA